MTDEEFNRWQSEFGFATGLGVKEAPFVEAWKSALEPFDPADASAAIATLLTDPRLPRTLPRDRLPLILEHAQAIREARIRAETPRRVPGSKPPRGSPWDAFMLKHGVIDKKEFARRERERTTKK